MRWTGVPCIGRSAECLRVFEDALLKGPKFFLFIILHYDCVFKSSGRA
jgi:hypothetical protein